MVKLCCQLVLSIKSDAELINYLVCVVQSFYNHFTSYDLPCFTSPLIAGAARTPLCFGRSKSRHSRPLGSKIPNWPGKQRFIWSILLSFVSLFCGFTASKSLSEAWFSMFQWVQIQLSVPIFNRVLSWVFWVALEVQCSRALW